MLSVVGQGGMSICSVRREDCSRKSKTCCTHWLHQPMTTFMTWCPCFLGLRRWCKTHVDMVRSFSPGFWWYRSTSTFLQTSNTLPQAHTSTKHEEPVEFLADNLVRLYETCQGGAVCCARRGAHTVGTGSARSVAQAREVHAINDGRSFA